MIGIGIETCTRFFSFLSIDIQLEYVQPMTAGKVGRICILIKTEPYTGEHKVGAEADSEYGSRQQRWTADAPGIEMEEIDV